MKGIYSLFFFALLLYGQNSSSKRVISSSNKGGGNFQLKVKEKLDQRLEENEKIDHKRGPEEVLNQNLLTFENLGADSMRRLKYLTKDIFVIVKHELMRNKNLMLYAKGKQDLKWSVFSEEESIQNIIPIEKLPSNILSVYEKKQLRFSGNLPRWILEIVCRLIREHRYGDEFMSRNVTISYIPIWAFQMFTLKQKYNTPPGLVRQLFPRKTIHLLRRRLALTNKEEKYKLFHLKWDDLPIWVLELANQKYKSATIKNIGHDALCPCNVSLKHFLLRVLPFRKLDAFEDNKDFKVTVNKIPERILTFAEEVFKLREENKPLREYRVPLDEILNKIFKETRFKLHNNKEPIFSRDIEEEDFPNWLSIFLREINAKRNIIKNIAFDKSSFENLRGKTCCKMLEQNLLIQIPKAPWNNSTLLEVQPSVELRLGRVYVKNQWLEKTIRKNLKKTGVILKFHELPKWIFEIFEENEGINDVDPECLLQTNIKMKEILDMVACVIINGNGPFFDDKGEIILDKIPLWGMAVVQDTVVINLDNILKENDIFSLMKTIKLDELLDILFEIAMKENKGILKRDQPIEIPKWAVDYLSQKIKSYVVQFSPDNQVQVDRKGIDSEILDSYRKSNKPSVLLKNLVETRIKLFNGEKLTEKCVQTRKELPNWAVDLVKIKFQRYYHKRLLMPINLEWTMIPFWMIELLKCKMPENSFMNSGMDQNVTVTELVDFAIWITNATNHKNEKNVKPRVDFEDIPDWLVHFLWRHVRDEKEHFESLFTLRKLLDWAMVHNIRRKWGNDGERVLIFKENLMKLPKWALEKLKLALKECNQIVPPINLQVRNISFPQSAENYVMRMLNRRKFEIDADQISDILPYWLSEIIQYTFTKAKDTFTALQRMWNITGLLQWTTWFTKLKLSDNPSTSRIRLSDIPDWVIDLLKLMIRENPGDRNVMKYRISTEELISWGIEYTLKNKETTLIDISQHKKLIPNWAIHPLQIIINRVNDQKIRKDLEMPKNQLPLWLLDVIEKKLKSQKELDFKKVSYGVIELLQIKLQEYNSFRDVINADMVLQDFLEDSLRLVRKRKLGTGINTMLELKDLPEWATYILINSDKDNGSNINLLYQLTSLDKVINWSIKNSISKLELEGYKKYTFKGLPLWLIKVINHELNEDRQYSFINRKEILPTFVLESISQVEETYKKDLGMEDFTRLHLVPRWVMEFIENKFRKNEGFGMQQKVTMNELLKFSIWKIRTNDFSAVNSFVTILDLPDWIFYFLKNQLNVKTGDEMLFQSTMALIDVVDAAIKISLQDYLEDGTNISFKITEFPRWGWNLLKRKVKLVNKGKVRFNITGDPLPTWMVSKITEVAEHIYDDKKNMVIWELAPYWMVEFLKMQIKDKNKDYYSPSNHEFKVNEVIDFGLWITNRVNNARTKIIRRKLKLFDVPYWLIELIRGKTKFYGKEEYLLNDTMTLEEILSLGVGFSISKKTSNSYDQRLLDHIPKYMHIPRSIKKTLLFKVQNFDYERDSKKFQPPNNQLPIWAAEYLMKLVRKEYAGEREIINSFLWESVPYWLTEFLQYKLQRFCGSPKVMEMVVTLNEIVDWTVFMTNERKTNAKKELILEWTELPQWLIEFLTNQMKDNAIIDAVMSRPIQLNMLLKWTISNVTSDALDRNDQSTVQSGLKGIPTNIINFIQETIRKINSQKNKIRLNKGYFLLPDWVPLVINRTIKDILYDEFKNHDQISIIRWEIFNSWITHFMEEIIIRRNFEEEVMEYKTTMAKIIEFSVKYTDALINSNGRLIRKIEPSDLPEWLIEIIKCILVDAECNHSPLEHTLTTRDLLELAVRKSILLQPIKRYGILRKGNNQNRASPSSSSEVENIVQKEINHFNEQRKKLPKDLEDHKEARIFTNYLTISMAENIKEMVADWHEEIIAEERGNPWEFVPYWVIKFTQSIRDGNRGIRNLANFKLSLRKIVRWLIICIQKTKNLLARGDTVMWNDLPDGILRLIEIVRREGGNIDAMETKFTVQDIVRGGIISVIREDAIHYGVKKSDLIFKEMPENLMDLIVLAISDANSNDSVGIFQPNVNVLPSWAFKLISKAMEDVIGSKSSDRYFLPIVKWELTHSWVIDLLRLLIDRQHTEENVLNYKFTMEEIISIAVEQTKIRFNFQAFVARDIGLVDIPDCVVTFIDGVYKTQRDVNTFLQHGETIYSLLVWSLKNCSTFMFNARMSNNEATEDLPNWAVNIIMKEIDSFYNFHQPQIQTHPPNPLTYFTTAHFKRIVSNKVKDIEPYESIPAMEIIPYATVKFTQKILEIQKGRRDIMSYSVTIRQILQWILGFLQTVTDSNARNGRVTLPDIPKCIKHFIVDAGNYIEDRHQVMDFIVTLEEFIDYGIKEGIRSNLLGKKQKIVKTEYFEIPSEVVTMFTIKIRDMEDAKETYILDLITYELPPWAFQLIDNIRPAAPHKIPASRTELFYRSVMPESHMIDLFKLLISQFKTEYVIKNYEISLLELLKFSLSYAKTHYDFDETDDNLFFRFVDMPFWLMSYTDHLINSVFVKTDKIMQENILFPKLLTFFMVRNLEVLTDDEIDREISNFQSPEKPIQEWIKVSLQTRVHEYVSVEKPIKYEQPKHAIQIWMIVNIMNLFEQKIKERDGYMKVQVKFKYIPFWIINYIELQTEISQGNKFKMDSLTTLGDFLAWVVVRTACNKNESCIKNDLEWTDLPIWIVDYLIVKGEECGNPIIIENNVTTVGEIITWGIEYAVSRKVYNNDLKNSEVSIEDDWMNWFVHQEIESLHSNKYVKEYENLDFVFPIFLEETVEDIVKKHFDTNFSPNNLFSWEITPHWLTGILKIKLREYANDRSILDKDIFLSEVIEYAVGLTKHLNHKIKFGFIRKIRVIDLPEWLFEFMKFKRDDTIKTSISFIGLLTWGIKNSIRSKITKFENKEFDALSTVSDEQWVKDVLLMKIAMNSEGKVRKKFNKPMNYLPVWAIDFIHKEVKGIWHTYAEERPKDIWESIPYWLVQVLQSKLQEFCRRSVMKQTMTVSEILDWVIWINKENSRDLGINGRIEKDELFVQMADFLGLIKRRGNENKMTFQDIISWALHVTVSKTIVKKDTSSLLSCLSGMRLWTLKLINRAISLHNDNPRTIRLTFSQNEFPESVKKRFKEILQEIYAEKAEFSPLKREESLPLWIEVFVMHKFSQVNPEINLLEEEITVREILEFSIQLTQTIHDKIQIDFRCNIRWIHIPFWALQLIRKKSSSCKSENCLMSQRMKLDNLLVWALHNSIRWTISEKDDGKQNKPPPEPEIPMWLNEMVEMKLKISTQGDFRNKHEKPLNHLPVCIVEYILGNKLEISEMYGTDKNNVIVPFWVVELIQSRINYHINIKRVMGYSIHIEKIVEWVIWNISRKKSMLGGENVVKMSDIPEWAVKLITETDKVHQISNRELGFSITLREILSMSMTFDMRDKKQLEYLPYWVLMMFQDKLKYINQEYNSNEFKEIKAELPRYVMEYVFTSARKKYNISTLLNPKDSLDIIPHSLLEYMKMKISEFSDGSRKVMRYKVRHREVFDYAFWFTKKHKPKSGEMTTDDIPYWLLMYIKTKVLEWENNELAFYNKTRMIDLLNWGIYYGVHLKHYGKVMLIPKSLEILPEWIIQYLLHTLNTVNNWIYERPNPPSNDLPDWALITIFSLMEIVYKDNYYSLPKNSTTIVPNWAIHLFQFKINEFKGSSNALSSNMTVSEFVQWSMQNALSIRGKTNLNYRLELHDIPEAVIDLLQVKLKRYANDQSFLKLNMTTIWILRWAIENNIEKAKIDEKNTTLEMTPYSEYFPKWFLNHLEWRIKNSNNRQLKGMFHENLKPAPEWMTEFIREKFREHSDLVISHKHKLTWKTLPTWLKTLVMINMDDKSNIKSVMLNKMTIDDIVYYSLWFTKHSTDWEENLVLSDIPKWSLELYANITDWKETEESILSKRFTLEEIIDCAIKNHLKKYREKQEKERLIDWSSIDVHNWVGDYLKQINVNENSLPTIIPDWVPTVVETVLKEYSGEDFLVKDYILTKYLSYDISKKYGPKPSMTDIVQVAESLIRTIKIKLKQNEMDSENNKTNIPSKDFQNVPENDIKQEDDKRTSRIRLIIKFLEETLEYIKGKIRFLIEDYKKLTKLEAGAFGEETSADALFYNSDN